MKLDELKDEQLAWDGLHADMTLEEIPKWLRMFAISGYCGHDEGDAFCASSNSTAEWVGALSNLLQQKIEEFSKRRKAVQ